MRYEDIFATAKELGIDGVEIVHFDGPLNMDVTAEIIEAASKTGLLPSAVCGSYRHWIGDFDTNRRLDAVKGICTSLVYVQEMGAQGHIAPAAFGMFSRRLPPFQPPREKAEDEDALIDYPEIG
ncbi:hypothetical protein O9H85_04590 [Paenibacillus filicis]|uniref:Xylose isomerase-like TIM barrel domain-containing protein n=1 Tax=Paenibacillus gyeongsangnamensis TaxID=3388067 RepID=A0ABT4Q4D4_9BACL|nr:TIM barrel protein [Paenibacillus filicis]MCZ8511712.1 hypothetical protein [Paenibacillus filicis]